MVVSVYLCVKFFILQPVKHHDKNMSNIRQLHFYEHILPHKAFLWRLLQKGEGETDNKLIILIMWHL